MFSDSVIDRLVEANKLPIDAFDKLLKIYIAPIDWEPHIKELFMKYSQMGS